MLEFIGPALQHLFTLENFIWINLGVFIVSVFAAVPGLTVILCVILFLPFTYRMTAIPGMMFLLGIYCAGGYGGSVSAILINTPGTPHAATTMMDGHPLSQKGRTKAALKIALYASTFGGVFSALMLLFLGPQVAQVAAQLGTAEYFMVCLFGLTIIAGVSGKSMIKGVIAACIGLLISCIGADPMTSYNRFAHSIEKFLKGIPKCSAIVCCNYMIYCLVRQVLEGQGKKVPEDYSLVCFDYSRDDWELDGITCSIHQGCQIGREVAARLLKIIERNECSGQDYSCIMPPEIYVGRSISQIDKKPH